MTYDNTLKTQSRTTAQRRQTRIEAAGRMNLLLIDDDEVFGKIMKRAAARRGLTLSHVKSAEELARLKSIRTFDAVLLDYHLGTLKGSTVAGFLNIFFPGVPVIITSISSEWWHRSGANYPTCVRSFLHKDHKPGEIIAAAERLASENMLESNGMTEVDTESMESYEDYAWQAPQLTTRRHLYISTMAKLGQGLLNITSGLIQKGKF